MCQTLMLKFGVKFAFAHQNTLEMDGSTDTAFRFHISLFYDYHSNYENVLVNGIFASNNNKIDKKAHTQISPYRHITLGTCVDFSAEFVRLSFFFACRFIVSNKMRNKQTMIKCNLAEPQMIWRCSFFQCFDN